MGVEPGLRLRVWGGVPQADDPDVRAVQAVQAGERSAFRALVDRHAPAVFALIRSFTRDEALTEDLAQDSFVRAFRGVHQFDPARGRFRTWLLAIARNRCRDRLRARSLPTQSLGDESAVQDAAPSDVPWARALETLSPEHRIAFLLVHVYAMSMADVAQIENVAVGTIKSRASRAREHLRALLPQPEGQHERT